VETEKEREREREKRASYVTQKDIVAVEHNTRIALLRNLK